MSDHGSRCGPSHGLCASIRRSSQGSAPERVTFMPTPSVAEALAAVDAARNEIVALTQALVQLPTINTGYMPTGNETPAAELLKARYAAEGIEAEVVESDAGRGNVV